MTPFAALLERLILTPSRAGKLTLMADHFAATPDPDRGWALAAITRDLSFKAATPATLRALVDARVDSVLFDLSHDFVGDLAETISLIWPERPGANRPPTLSDIVDTLRASSKDEAARHVERWLDALDATGRWALIKLVTGGLRIGVSPRLAKQAAANFGAKPVSEIEELWHALEAPYADLFAWLEGRAPKPAPDVRAPFRPVMLANALVETSRRGAPDTVDPDRITPQTFAAEWKWDGVRVQAVSDAGERRLYTRSGDDISPAFPDVLAAMDFDGALDGELLIRSADGGVAPFGELQQRLNRTTATKKQIADRPAFVRAYDLLAADGADLRAAPFKQRRARLEDFVADAASARFDLSELVAFADLDDLAAKRAAPPAPEIEGVMLKRWDSVYEPGRPNGPWLKWRRNPFLIDAVLMYARRGDGQRANLYSDVTFGVWRDGDDGPELVPVGKAAFGFTDDERKAIDAYVRAHTVERFGPVRAVTADLDHGLVLEIAFDGLIASARHKSGVALRAPRVNRLRQDKPAADADRLETLTAMSPAPSS